MPNVYGVIIWGSCLGTILLPVGLFVFIIKKRPDGRFADNILWLLVLILFCGISSCMFDIFLAGEIQARIAVPYIQKALNKQCQDTSTRVDTNGFSFDFGFRWESPTGNESCYYAREWYCDCNLK
jgi:hypothetical protein